MEVKINREIRNYTESMFWGLSLWQLILVGSVKMADHVVREMMGL